jgi:hypothetical protein
MTRYVAQNDIRIVNNELEWIRKGAVVASYEISPGICLKGQIAVVRIGGLRAEI